MVKECFGFAEPRVLCSFHKRRRRAEGQKVWLKQKKPGVAEATPGG